MSNSDFSVPVILDSNSVLVKGPVSNISKLMAYINQHYNKSIFPSTLKTYYQNLPSILFELANRLVFSEFLSLIDLFRAFKRDGLHANWCHY